MSRSDFLRIGNGINDVLHCFSRRAARADLNCFGIVHRPFDERFDLRRNRRGKKRGVTLARAAVEDAAHVGQKTHVEHPVGFVENEKLDGVEAAIALLDVVEQSSGRGDEDVHAFAQGVVLPSVADAAVEHGDFQICETRVIAERRLDLRGQFARRFKDQNARSRFVRAELGKNRQSERGGLARAGLCAADDVASGEHERD